VLDGIGDGFYAVDCDWRIILFNNEAAQHFQRTPAEVLGRNLWEAFPRARETGLGQLFLRTMQNRETIRSETESVIFGGRWLAYRLFPLGDGIGVVFRDITDRRSAEAQRDLLVKELEHRIKNTLATVLSIAEQTFRNSGIDPSLQKTFAARLVSLSNVHSVLTQRSWDSADLHEVIASAIGPHRAEGEERFDIQGPILRLGPKTAVALSMAVHELCTNAIKYGALSLPGGRVEVAWEVLGADDGRALRLIWKELDGPPVEPPTRSGFGRVVSEQMIAAALNATVRTDFAPRGVEWTLELPASEFSLVGSAAA
jgi:two-component sensor histidine kinase